MDKKGIKSKLRPLRKIATALQGAILFRFSNLVISLLKPNLILTYDNAVKPDGVGAQVQRILALRSMASNLGLNYFHTEIDSVAVHPLDPYQTQPELKDFVTELNRTFNIESTVDLDLSKIKDISIRSLTFTNLIVLTLKSVVYKEAILIRCLEPYAVCDHDSNIYKGVREFLPNFKPIEQTAFTLGIHYRRGVGGMAVQQGESVSRELKPQYLIGIANKLTQSRLPSETKIRLYTDAPKDDLQYAPPKVQADLWSNSPRFEQGIMSVIGADPDILFNDLLVTPQVIRGGDPLVAIRELAGLNALIMSRSSFSYLGAILNNRGKIYFPKSFWHRPMAGWEVVSEGLTND